MKLPWHEHVPCTTSQSPCPEHQPRQGTFDAIRLDRICFGWIGIEWNGMDWIGMDGNGRDELYHIILSYVLAFLLIDND